MIDQFLAAFGPISPPPSPQEPPPLPPLWEGGNVAGYAELMGAYAGATCRNGLYRLHTAASAAEAAASVALAFPRYRNRLAMVGVDWLGRHYALHIRLANPADANEPLLISIDPEGEQADPEPGTFADFHTGDGVQSCSPARWEAWAVAHPDLIPLASGSCVGLRVPIFLGGTDTPANMAVLDTATYWRAVIAQLRQLAELPPLRE